MSTFLYNDFVGAVFSFVALVLGWAGLLAIIAAGFWVSFLYVARRVLELVAVAKRDFRRLLGGHRKPCNIPAIASRNAERRLVSVKP